MVIYLLKCCVTCHHGTIRSCYLTARPGAVLLPARTAAMTRNDPLQFGQRRSVLLIPYSTQSKHLLLNTLHSRACTFAVRRRMLGLWGLRRTRPTAQHSRTADISPPASSNRRQEHLQLGGTNPMLQHITKKHSLDQQRCEPERPDTLYARAASPLLPAHSEAAQFHPIFHCTALL